MVLMGIVDRHRDRDDQLKNLNETFKNDSGKGIEARDVRIVEAYSKFFDEELMKAGTYAKDGDYVNAKLHENIAQMINIYLKRLI
jgi:hypothetical protein